MFSSLTSYEDSPWLRGGVVADEGIRGVYAEGCPPHHTLKSIGNRTLIPGRHAFTYLIHPELEIFGFFIFRAFNGLTWIPTFYALRFAAYQEKAAAARVIVHHSMSPASYSLMAISSSHVSIFVAEGLVHSHMPNEADYH